MRIFIDEAGNFIVGRKPVGDLVPTGRRWERRSQFQLN
jgi:hypothetical protein